MPMLGLTPWHNRGRIIGHRFESAQALRERLVTPLLKQGTPSLAALRTTLAPPALITRRRLWHRAVALRS